MLTGAIKWPKDPISYIEIYIFPAFKLVSEYNIQIRTNALLGYVFFFQHDTAE